MPVVTVFSGTFCNESDVIEELVQRTGYHYITDEHVVKKAAVLANLGEEKIRHAMAAKTSVFNKFTHEKERSIAWLRLAVAEKLSEKNDLIIDGLCGLLIPQDITHVLRVCLIAGMKSRTEWAKPRQGSSQKATLKEIHQSDLDRTMWVHSLFKVRDPWDSSLHDIVAPTDRMTVPEIVDLIEDNLRSEVIQPTDTSRRAATDFHLAARVGVALAKEGHNVDVSARDGAVTVMIHQNVLMLGRLEEELKAIAAEIDGVQNVETRIGKGFHRTDIYRKYNFDTPKLLLVDDEREFVQTLSERLLMRDVGSAVAYDGKSALEMIDEEDPEVMILDLNMPGIDGIGVLREVKRTRPEIKVIILTGHGSDKDREICMELGAFAYLQKPVNIDVLSEKLKEAKEKMRHNRNGLS
ncbi:MAG: response regulator [Desulfobacteraceae bacterium]|jgi:CheY-like chemotaxis protein|nr:response regulator [Desulfobacteraceae bacterium]